MTVAAACAALLSASCSNELTDGNDNLPPDADSPKAVLTFGVTQGGDTQDEASTRMTFAEYDVKQDGSAGMAVKWEADDKLAVFHYDNSIPSSTYATFNAVPNSLSKDGKTISFKGETILSTGIEKYVLCYPVPSSEYGHSVATNNNGVVITYDLLTQTQDCTSGNETNHLKHYNLHWQISDWSKSITLRQSLSILRFDLTLPEAKAINSITLKSEAAIFFKGFKLTIKNNGGMETGATETVQEITLNLENDGADTSVKAYMMGYIDLGSNIKSGSFWVIAKAADGTEYNGATIALTEYPLESGTCKTIKQTLYQSGQD